MNLIDESRIRALELHQAAVERGSDPKQLLAFAIEEAEFRGIEVAPRPPQNPQLRGGFAVYDFDQDIIFYSHEGSDFDQAFRIAHEIGHAEFSSSSGTYVLTDPDPSCSSEIGDEILGPVVDYGRRQRREVQMDLFAREFLLPRFKLNDLHVEQGLSAGTISVELDVPYNVVAVQLLDGLLLPIVEKGELAASTAKPLNDPQRLAAEHDDRPLLLEAGPGTGKTQTLVGRISFLKEKSADPARILVLTYSNKAAYEMQSRITKEWPEAAGSMWIGTFHSFGFDLVRRFFDQFGLSDNPKLLDQVETAALLEDEFARLNLKHFGDLYDPTENLKKILSAISRAKDEVVDDQRYEALAIDMRSAADDDNQDDVIAAERCLEVAEFYKRYEALKAHKSYLDFGDLVSKPVELMEKCEQVRTLVASGYDHILVDEYQDVNRASVRLLQALSPDGKNLWTVGDAKQSIYRFRGASSFNVSRFGVGDFPGGLKRQLETNYRSSQEICDTFSSFASSEMKAASGTLNAVAHRGSTGNRPVHITAKTKIDEIQAIADEINKAKECGFNFKDQAVLCKGNDRLSELAKGLEALELPVLYLGPLFERAEIRDLLSIMSLVIDNRAASLVRVASMPDFKLALEDVERIVDLLAAIKPSKPLDWCEHALLVQELTANGRIGLAKLTSALKKIGPEEQPWMLVSRFLLDETRIAAELSKSDDISKRTQAIAFWQFHNFLCNLPREGEGYPIKRAIDHIRQIMKLSDDRELRQLPSAAMSIDAVKLMTIHGSKGLEFPVVHMPSLTNASVPGTYQTHRDISPPPGMIFGETGTGVQGSKDSHEEEQECLFFVGLSRAETLLRLYSPAFQKNGTTNQPRSKFLDRLGNTLDWKNADTAISGSITAIHEDVSVDFDLPLDLRLSHVGQYERCPRRFLYTYVLKLGGRRKETAFIKMHTAIQGVIDQICRGDDTLTTWPEIEPIFDVLWAEVGPSESPNSESYKAIGRRLLKFYLNHRGTKLHVDELTLIVAAGDCRIEIIFDEHLTAGALGTSALRRIRTGRKTTKSDKNWEAAILQIAVDHDTTVSGAEYLFLSDEEFLPLTMSAKVLGNRMSDVTNMSTAIIAGSFPAKPGPYCPSCPHYFSCGTLPSGRILKKSFK